MRRGYVMLSTVLFHTFLTVVLTVLIFFAISLLVPKCGMSCLGWGFFVVIVSPMLGFAASIPVTRRFYNHVWKHKKYKR